MPTPIVSSPCIMATDMARRGFAGSQAHPTTPASVTEIMSPSTVALTPDTETATVEAATAVSGDRSRFDVFFAGGARPVFLEPKDLRASTATTVILRR